jgi:hypothetical protein
MITNGGAVKILDKTKPTATKAVAHLIGHGVLKETTGRRRGRTFAYAAYVDLLRKGTSTQPQNGRLPTDNPSGSCPPRSSRGGARRP